MVDGKLLFLLYNLVTRDVTCQNNIFPQSLQTESWKTWKLAKGSVSSQSQFSWPSRCSVPLGEEGNNLILPFPFQMQIGRGKY